MGSLNDYFDDKKKDLSEIVEEFLNESKASDIRQTLEDYPELLSEEADSILDAISKNSQDEEIIDAIQDCRSFLARCREVGIAQVFEEISSYSREMEDLADTIFELINSSDANDARRIIEQHPELLSEEVDSMLDTLSKNVQDEETLNAIQDYRNLLTACREVGIEQAFEEISNSSNETSEDFKKILDEIDSLSRPQDMPRKIILLRQALSLFPRQLNPEFWAALQSELGKSLVQNPLGDKGGNIERAIGHFNQAIEVYTQKDSPVQWAVIQNNLAIAYKSRIQGDMANNIEEAIKHYNQALKIRTRQAFPVDWADTQNNLANAYRIRILEKKAENIEKAIEHYKQALEVRTRQAFPVKWAETQNNLALAYNDRILGDRAQNIERAIEHYKQALEVHTRQIFPVDWAKALNNLANAYYDRILGDKAENIELAIEYYNQSIMVRTQKDFPIDWAMTQNNLANSYKDRIMGDRAENIKQAINHYNSSLEIYKLESMPTEFRRVCKLLGDLYFDIGQWKDAVESYKNAIKAGGILYRSGLSADSKSSEVTASAYIYRNASFAAYRQGLASEALMFLEQGKTRLLSEALRLKMKQPKGVPNEEWIKYEQAAEKYRNATRLSSREEDYAQKEKKVQEALKELDEAVEVIQTYNHGFQKELEISDISSVLDNETALLTFCITNKGSIGFLVSESNGIQSVDIADFKEEELNNLLFKPDEQGNITGGWVVDYSDYVYAQDARSRMDAFNAWNKTLNAVLYNIGSRLLFLLLEELPPQIKKLILLPSGGLFLLPLHAVSLPDGQVLCQRYCISYAPSVPLLKEMQNDAMTTEGEDLYAVINPQEDPALVFSGCEGQAISKLFKSRQVNVGKTGTRATVLEGVSGKAYLHFSCHGNYNWNDPPQSGLYLVGGRTLSLADLQNDEVNISSARLVTLSACETGITDILRGSADEFVGLPAGFMLAGVPCVISSLWSVPDISTAILMERFYSNHIERGMDIPMALQNAQLWVRDLTSSEVAGYVEKCYQSGKWEDKSKENIERYRESILKMAKEFPDEKLFQHPYYWAAFTVNGA